MYDYGARWYDPALGRFIQPDTIVPNPHNAQAFDRYAYVFNNPLRYADPSGHTGVAIHDSNDGPPVAMSYNTMGDIQEDYYNLGVSWTNLPHDVRTAFEAQGATGYMDFHGNATSQNGTIRDPAVIGASAFGVGRLVWQLPGLLMGACADGDCTNEVEAVNQVSQSDRVSNAYQIAKEGGKHAGFLRNYVGRSVDQIRKGISSIEQLIAEHRDKVANPEKYIPNFRELDPRQQEALLTRKWPADIQRQTEQLEILKGLLDELLK